MKEDWAKHRVVDERYMAKEIEDMDSILNKKRKRQHVVMTRENGWDLAYEDDMSLGDNNDDDSVGAGAPEVQL